MLLCGNGSLAWESLPFFCTLSFLYTMFVTIVRSLLFVVDIIVDTALSILPSD